MPNAIDYVFVSERAAMQSKPEADGRGWRRGLLLLLLLFAFLVGIRGLGGGFKLLGADLLDHFFSATENPFVGLAVGILATTLVQSSSVTTSMVVALVAAPEQPLPIANAIPMVMGANIGTTVTNTVVSMGHLGRPREFRRAFAAATCHDFFNFIAVAILLPFELVTGALQNMSGFLARIVPADAGADLPNPVKAAAALVLDPVQDTLLEATPNELVGALLFLALSALVIFFSLYAIVRTLRKLTASRVEHYVVRALDERPVAGMALGAATTAMVQSSSITTSILVPFAGAGIVTLEHVFPIALGANVGTTLTALIASMGAPSQTLHFAVQISLVHLLFNVIGIAIVYPIRRIRRIPLGLARWLARTADRSKPVAVAYLLGLFYALPALLAVVWAPQ